MSPSPRVLVVDDDEGLGLLVVSTLEEIGIPARAILSGREALQSLRIQTPELLLLDLGLSDVSGATLLNLLKEEKINVPFIVVTGQGDERVAVQMMKQGALDYLIKDAGMLDRLPHIVKRALEKLEGNRALADARSALVESEKQILAISEGERRNIGADLHDNLGQQLTAIELLCQSMRHDLRDQPELEARMAQICKFLQESVAQTRQLARGLTPVFFEAGGLTDSLAELARRMSTEKIPCDFYCPAPIDIPDQQAATQLFRIAQEAINNASKHGRARKISVTLTGDGGKVTLTVKDDGQGFDEKSRPAAGLGLQIMRHRANVIGAELEITSASRKGVTVVCKLGRHP